ncbi:NAD-dependent epimerase, partial [Burkholderia cenocepacia]
MKVMITGGAGFLGTLLARRLLDVGIDDRDAGRRTVDELVLVDLAAPHASVSDDPRVRAVIGDLQ